MIKIGIQKSGYLTKKSINLINNLGINVNINNCLCKKLVYKSKKIKVKIFLLRNNDILNFVEYGYIDLGIIGSDLLLEYNKKVKIEKYLNFGICRLSISAYKNIKFNNIYDLNNMNISTSYPNILNNFLCNYNIFSNIHVMNGSVESSIEIGVSDYICDIIDTGRTLYINNLKEIFTILYCKSILISSFNKSKNKKLCIKKILKLLDI